MDTFPMDLLSSSTHMGWVVSKFCISENNLFSNCSVVGCSGRSMPPKADPLWFANPSKSITCAPFLFKACSISVLPVPVYPPKTLRCSGLSKESST